MLHQVRFDVRTSCSPVQAAPATYCTQHPRDAYGHMSARNDGAGMRRETLEAERPFLRPHADVFIHLSAPPRDRTSPASRLNYSSPATRWTATKTRAWHLDGVSPNSSTGPGPERTRGPDVLPDVVT